MITERRMVGVPLVIHKKLKEYAHDNGLTLAAAIDKALLSARLLDLKGDKLDER